MNDVTKQIAKSIFVQQTAAIGVKLINNKRVTQADETGWWLSLLLLAVTHWPSQQVLPETQGLSMYTRP
jgi:hypothetical protein